MSEAAKPARVAVFIFADISRMMSDMKHAQTTSRPLYIHNTSSAIPYLSLHRPGLYTRLHGLIQVPSGDSALQSRTLLLYSEANARVIPTEAYALLFRATRDVSSLIVPRIGHLSLVHTPMESKLACANPR